ncbi:MAG: T9SS type A sorting domain-containing protein [Saprospiraceae bacterium]|nr:T9SS type A sorting domain-containing protein [Candidatus Defluviibacterium haderslevense]
MYLLRLQHTCFNEFLSTYVGLVATHNINKQALLKTTPNPFSDQIIVAYESLKKYSNYHLQIRNIHGIMTHDIQVQQKGKVEINTKLIPSGVYELMFLADDQILSSKKIVKILSR